MRRLGERAASRRTVHRSRPDCLPVPAGGQQQVKMVRQEAVAVQEEGIAPPRLGQGVEKGGVVVGAEENGGAVVASVESMVQQTVGAWMRHGMVPFLGRECLQV